jgi:hypothetical protein
VTKARNTQAIVKVAYQGSPKARLAQAIVKVAYQGSPKARLAQAIVKVAYIDSGVPGGGGAQSRFYAQVIG